MKESQIKEEACQDRERGVELQFATLNSDILNAAANVKSRIENHAQMLLQDIKLHIDDYRARLQSAKLRVRNHIDTIQCADKHMVQLGKYGPSVDLGGSMGALTRKHSELDKSHRSIIEDCDLDMDLGKFEKSEVFRIVECSWKEYSWKNT